MDGNNLILTSKTEDGRSGIRVYEFTDSGLVIVSRFRQIVNREKILSTFVIFQTLTSGDVTAKRYYSRA